MHTASSVHDDTLWARVVCLGAALQVHLTNHNDRTWVGTAPWCQWSTSSCYALLQQLPRHQALTMFTSFSTDRQARKSGLSGARSCLNTWANSLKTPCGQHLLKLFVISMALALLGHSNRHWHQRVPTMADTAEARRWACERVHGPACPSSFLQMQEPRCCRRQQASLCKGRASGSTAQHSTNHGSTFSCSLLKGVLDVNTLNRWAQHRAVCVLTSCMSSRYQSDMACRWRTALRLSGQSIP